MDINNRIASLDKIFQELKEVHPLSMYVCEKKYKLTHEELMHIESMLWKTGLVDKIDEDYARTEFRLNDKGVDELKIHGSYSDFLADLKPKTQPIITRQTKINQIFQKAGSFIVSNIWQIIVAVTATILAGYLVVKFKIPH